MAEACRRALHKNSQATALGCLYNYCMRPGESDQVNSLANNPDVEWYNQIAGMSDGPPIFGLAPEDVQRGTVGKTGANALFDAFMFWRFVHDMAAKYDKPIGLKTRVLDFGVSWGRILRFFARDTATSCLYGVDIEERFLEFARRDLPRDVNLERITSEPPLPFPEASIDVIYAYSVFSHLPQDLADAWVADFARVLKPGGIACLTTRPRAHLRTPTEAYATAIGDPAKAEDRYDKGEFLFFPMDGGGAYDEATFGEAVIPAAYAERAWGQYLIMRGLKEQYSEKYLQPCFVMQKPA